jgi:GTP cyclohydrolase FolE2
MIATMPITHHNGSQPYTMEHIVTSISVEPRKPIGVKVVVTTLCGGTHQIKRGRLTMHYDTRYPVVPCATCNDRYSAIRV